ncbi:MAG: hypothetical protein P4L83_18940 [Nevskia sp.]|nr:hypothetical protein [Nevskia sp.]
MVEPFQPSLSAASPPDALHMALGSDTDHPSDSGLPEVTEPLGKVTIVTTMPEEGEEVCVPGPLAEHAASAKAMPDNMNEPANRAGIPNEPFFFMI